MKGSTLIFMVALCAACVLWLGSEPEQAHAVPVCAGPQAAVCIAAARAAARGVTRVGRGAVDRVRGRSGSGAPRSRAGRAGRAAAGAGAAAGLVGLEALTGGVSEGASWLIRQTIAALDASARVDLEAAWFSAHYGLMATLAAFLLLPLLLVSLTMSLLRGDWLGMIRAILLYVPASIFLTAAVVTVTQTGLAAVDAFSADLADDVSERSGEIAASVGSISLVGGVPAFVGLLIGLVMSLAALAVWLELVLRAAAIYVAAFAPVFFAGIVWPRLQGWASELARLLVALVLSKLVIVSVLSLGLSGVTELDGVSGVVSGAAIFALAAFAPFVILSLLPLASGIGAGVGVQARSAIGEAGGLRRVWGNAQRRMAGPAGGMQPAAAAAHAGAGTAASGRWSPIGAEALREAPPATGGGAAETRDPAGHASGSSAGEASIGRSAVTPAPAPSGATTAGSSGQAASSSRVSESTATRIVRESRAGSSFAQIARGLDAAGVPTPRGGERWSPSTVRAVMGRQADATEAAPQGESAPRPTAGRRIDPQRDPGGRPS